MKRPRTVTNSLLLPSVAVSVFLTACSAGDAPAEPTAASNRARTVESIADQAEPHTLYVVANDYATGTDVEPDQELEEQLWLIACEKGHPESCGTLGGRLIGAGRLEEAERVLLQGAELADLSSVKNLIEIYANDDWSGSNPMEAARWRGLLEQLGAAQPQHSPATTSQDDPFQSPGN